MSRKTYRGRTREEQAAFNKARRAKHAATAARREAKELGTPLDALPGLADLAEFQPEIAVEKVEVPSLSLSDRILAKFNRDEEEKEPPTTRQGKEQIEKSGKLISHILPMTLAGLCALYAKNLFSERYKACAPSQTEVATILLPTFSIISRHIGLEGRATQDALDAGAILLASITIGTRMLMTAEEIKAQKEPSHVSQSPSSTATNSREPATASGNNQSTDNRNTVLHQSQNAALDPGAGAEHADRDGNRLRGNDASTDGASEAERVAALLRKDTLGRRSLGLAPRVFLPTG